MTKFDIFKVAARTIVGIGTSTVTNSIIRNNVAPTNSLQAVSIGVTALVIGSMASEATKAHTDAKLDEFAAIWTKNKTTDDPTLPTD